MFPRKQTDCRGKNTVHIRTTETYTQENYVKLRLHMKGDNELNRETERDENGQTGKCKMLK